MEIEYMDSLVKKYCELSRKDREVKSREEDLAQDEAWLAYEREYIEWAKGATKEELEYFQRFIDLEWIGMTCNGIRYEREQEKRNGE